MVDNEKIIPPAGEVNKTPENNKENMVPQSRVDQIVAHSHKLEDELINLKKNQEIESTKKMEATKQFETLYQTEKKKVEIMQPTLTAMETAFKTLLDAEMVDLKDEQKTLIPSGTSHEQLIWLKKAKAAGVFTGQTPPPQTFDGKPRTNLPAKWYLGIKSSDPRFNDLTNEQYLEWKSHNQKAIPVKGGF